MIAAISLIQRLAGISTDQFRRHWLDVHGPLVASFPRLQRYVQSHVADAATDAARTVPIDGFAELWFANREDRDLAYASPALAACDIDSTLFIGQVLRLVTAPTDIVPLRRSETCAKLVAVLIADGTAPEVLLARQATVANTLAGLCGATQHSVHDQHRPPRSQVAGLAVTVAALTELWFDDAASREVAITALADPAAALYRVDEHRFI